MGRSPRYDNASSLAPVGRVEPLWTLHFGDRYGSWTLCFDLAARQSIDVITAELEADPTCVFWG